MKALQKLAPMAWWLFRIAILLFFLARYGQAVLQIDFNSASFYISAIFLLSAVLLFIGGFYKNGNLARIAGLFLFLVSIYEAYHNSSPLIGFAFSQYLLLSAIGLLFLTRKENI
ncbi:MAG TPA: hypothetical protein VMV56_05015 [Williamwhitmania sp.]|nr:hypothetical protein [Williamwhitmania sp.]